MCKVFFLLGTDWHGKNYCLPFARAHSHWRTACVSSSIIAWLLCIQHQLFSACLCVFRPRAERVGPSMLVLSPTRELAQQIQAEVNKYSYKGITSVCVYGGGDRQTQIRAFRRGVEIVIGKLYVFSKCYCIWTSSPQIFIILTSTFLSLNARRHVVPLFE